MNLPCIVWEKTLYGTIKSLDVKSGMPVGHVSGDVENSVNHMSLEFRAEVQGRNVNVAVVSVYI